MTKTLSFHSLPTKKQHSHSNAHLIKQPKMFNTTTSTTNPFIYSVSSLFFLFLPLSFLVTFTRSAVLSSSLQWLTRLFPPIPLMMKVTIPIEFICSVVKRAPEWLLLLQDHLLLVVNMFLNSLIVRNCLPLLLQKSSGSFVLPIWLKLRRLVLLIFVSFFLSFKNLVSLVDWVSFKIWIEFI